MASALATLAAIAVFSMLAMPSLGHRRTGPLCSDCASLCSANCSAAITASCGGICTAPTSVADPSRCVGCQAMFRHMWCADCCNNGCPAAGCDPPCNCDNCTDYIIGMACRDYCRTIDRARQCQDCVGRVGSPCSTDCNKACKDNCLKKGKGC